MLHFLVLRHSQMPWIIHQVAAMSKRLVHRNIVPLFGITAGPPEFVSNWMPGGDLPAYIAKLPDANRLSIVRFLQTTPWDRPDPLVSYLTSPRVSTTCIHAT
jgi:hypothetical protein